jgi:F0F1-type ATP synthase membrane subunit b/b'
VTITELINEERDKAKAYSEAYKAYSEAYSKSLEEAEAYYPLYAKAFYEYDEAYKAYEKELKKEFSKIKMK